MAVKRKRVLLEIDTTATHSEIRSAYHKGRGLSVNSLLDTVVIQCQVNKVKNPTSPKVCKK